MECYFYFDEIAWFKMFVWQKTLLNFNDFADKQFSLDDIEHGILRANREHPSRKQSQFNLNDPREVPFLPGYSLIYSQRR